MNRSTSYSKPKIGKLIFLRSLAVCKMKHILFSFFMFFCLAGYGQSLQDTTTLWQIETLDGNVYLGKLIRQSPENIVLQTSNLGLLTIKKTDVKSMNPLIFDGKKNNRLLLANRQIDRYFFQSSGFGLRKGEAYFQNNWVLLNQVNVGITNNFSLGIGAVPLFLFSGAPTPVWITPKISAPLIKDQLNVSAGAFIGSVIGVKNNVFGITYGAATVGSRDRNVTFGLGYGFVNGFWANRPSFSLSGMIRVGKKTYLMTENYWLGTQNSSVAVLSFGGRTVWPKISLDYGLIVPRIDGEIPFIALPWLGVAIPLGKH